MDVLKLLVSRSISEKPTMGELCFSKLIGSDSWKIGWWGSCVSKLLVSRSNFQDIE